MELSMIHGPAERSGGPFRLDGLHEPEGTAPRPLPVTGEVVDGAVPVADAPRDGPVKADRRLRVLAVDDDALVLMGTAGMLEDLGHEVLAAMSGDAALEAFAANGEIDLLVTDQSMPRMTGLDLVRTLRERHPDLPVILATGYADLPEETTGRPILRLDKPFGPDQLRGAIEDAMRDPG